MATSVTSAGLKAAADEVIIAAQPVVETLKLFAHNFSPNSANVGDGVAVEVLSATASEFGTANGYTKSTNGIKPASVTLSNHKKSTYTISDTDALENELSPVWQNLAPTAGKAVAKAIVADAIKLLNYTNADKQVTAATATLADFAAMRAAVVAEGLEPADCALVLTPATYAALLAVLPAHVLGGDSAIRYAQIGEFLGFKAVIESPNASAASSASANKCIGYVVPTGAIAVASRVVTPVRLGGNLVEFGTVSDDKSGLTFGMRVVVDADQGTASWTVDSLYGVSLTKQSSNGAPGYLQLINS